MTTFGPSAVPDQFEPIIAGGGLLVVIAALAWPWIEQSIRDRSIAFRLAKSPSKSMPEWVPLAAAIGYLARDTKWAEKVGPVSADEADDLLQREFLEQAARGKLACRGVPRSREFRTDNAATTVPIKADFFETAYFQPLGEILRSDGTPDKLRDVMTTAGKYSTAKRATYAGVVVKSADLLATWHPRRRSKQPTSIKTAIELYMRNARQNPDWEFDVWTDMFSQHEPTGSNWRPLFPPSKGDGFWPVS